MTKSKSKNLLEKTKTYLIGHMQYKTGRDWRKDVTDELQPLGITVFDPYHKPFVEEVDEDEPVRAEMLQMMEDGKYDDLSRRMKKVRNYDLNLVDRSDFIIGNLQPEIASWGSAEEIVTAVREQKPLFIAIEGGKTVRISALSLGDTLREDISTGVQHDVLPWLGLGETLGEGVDGALSFCGQTGVARRDTVQTSGFEG